MLFTAICLFIAVIIAEFVFGVLTATWPDKKKEDDEEEE